MSPSDVPERVKNFIFEHVDSVEQLEILLLLNAQRDKSWTVQALSDEMRSNPQSIEQRLKRWLSLGLISETGGSSYIFSPPDPSVEDVIRVLADNYRVQRHRVLELIFSPMKMARDFASAFRVGEPKSKKGDDNG